MPVGVVRLVQLPLGFVVRHRFFLSCSSRAAIAAILEIGSGIGGVKGASESTTVAAGANPGGTGVITGASPVMAMLVSNEF